jgi:ribonuclease G
LPEWIIERGIGETRAALIDGGEIIEARVRRDGVTAAGTVLDAKLVEVAPRVTVEGGGEQFLLPRGVSGVSEGRAIRVEVTREALGGSEPWKRGLARVTEEAAHPAPPLAEGREAAIEGWDDLLEEARSGIVGFQGGELRIEPTAAMITIDVDGWLVPDRLAQMAAWAVGRACRRIDLAGSIGIDFPMLADKAARREVDQILDDYLPRPFERTAINGFGFVQVVRPKSRPSLIELARDRANFEARALLRTVGRSVGAIGIVAQPRVIAVIEAHPDWVNALQKDIGGRVELRADPKITMVSGYAENL